MDTGLAARRGLRVFAITVLAAAGAVGGLAGAARAATSACTRTSGVTVIVEYRRGTVERGCAPGRPANGLAALNAAGFTYDGTAQYGDAFVCRIDGNPADQACTSTPPANAYWAYAHARPTDAGWTYWNTGAATSRPEPGSIDAWAFGANVRPSVAPAAVAPPPPPPTPTTRPMATSATTTRPQSTTTATSAGIVVRSGVAATAPATTVARAGATQSTTPTTAGATTSSSARGSDTSLPHAIHIIARASAPPAPAHSSSGSPLPVLLGVGVLAAAGIGGYVLVRARRRVVT